MEKTIDFKPWVNVTVDEDDAGTVTIKEVAIDWEDSLLGEYNMSKGHLLNSLSEAVSEALDEFLGLRNCAGAQVIERAEMASGLRLKIEPRNSRGIA